MKVQSVVRCSFVQLCVGILVALPGMAQAAGKDKLSSQTVLGVPCSEVFERGIDKMENLRAGMIMVGCGLQAPGGAEREGSPGLDSVDAVNINLITGPEVWPNVTQSESMVWAHGQTIVVNYNDSAERNTSPFIISSLSVSFDGGNTFERIRPSPLRGHGDNGGDPIVVYDEALGMWFAGDLVGGCPGIGLWTSTDAMTWNVGACAHIGGGDDRESMWVDNNAASPFFGRMYISWNDFGQTNAPLFVTYSNNGTTWSAPVRVSPVGPFIRNIQVTGTPGDDGTVFIAGMDEGGGGLNNRINWIYRSLDGGVTWTAIQQGPPFAPPGQTLGLCGSYFAAIPPLWRHMGWGQPAVGPNGVVHYAYAARGTNTGDLGDILYIRSADNGTTWSAPIVLNTDAAAGGNKAQWMPSVSATPEGVVQVTWYDRRNTTNETNYEYWGIISTDNGISFDPDEAISDVLIAQPEQPDPGIVGCYAGDYNYQSAQSGQTLITWTDGRNAINDPGGNPHNQQDVYFAMLEQTVTGGLLEGTVTDTTGNLVAGARVRAVGPVDRTTTTNRDGFYRLRLPAGTYDMTVTATDYNPGSATGVMVDEGLTTTQNFTLNGVGILEGTVMSSANAPIAGARVQAMGPVTRTTMTDNNGFYRLRLPVGTYDMMVTAFAYNPGTATVDVVDGMTTTQNFMLTLAPSHSVSGTVTDNVIGTPIQGATVRILNTPIPPATTDANGMYLLPSVPEGTYDIQASARGYSPSTRTGVIVNQDVVVDFALDPTVAPCNPNGIDIPSECDSVAGNLVANCGFETGNFPPWVRSGDQGFTSIDAASAHSGNFGLDIGPVGGLGFIAQNLPTTAGGRYNLSFWLENAGPPSDRFQVSWGGTVIFDTSDLPPFPYRQYCWVGTAPADSTELKFGFLQVPSFFHFDDVVVTPQ